MNDNDRTILERFALDHKVILEEASEVGMGRPCVGFTKGGCYIGYSRLDSQTFEEMEGWCDERLGAPEGVSDAYHKTDCVAVLAPEEDYETALAQLVKWVQHYNELGVELVEFVHQHTNQISLMMHGPVGYSLRVKAA